MLIKNLELKNYRSLQNIEMKNLQNLVILVGKNSSGKTNLLESIWLFSRDFALSPDTIAINAPLEANSFLWYNGDTSLPIDFNITLVFSPEENKVLFPEEFLEAFNYNTKECLITVRRQIVASPPNFSWKTLSLVCEGIPLIENGKIVEKLHEKVTLFNEEESEKIEEDKNEEGVLKLEFNELNVTQIKQQVLQNMTPEKIQMIITKLAELFKDKVIWIQSSRGTPSQLSNYGNRTMLVSNQINTSIIDLGQVISPKIRRRWRQFRRDFEKFSPYEQRINIVQGQIVVDERELGVPLSLVGGGSQEIITIIHEFKEHETPIIIIEEPENHLHPELSKKLFRYIRKCSEEKQIFIATHSPFFLHRMEIQNTWMVAKRNDESVIEKLIDKEDLRNVMLEIGLKPSDILFADAILLVEGPTEEEVIPILARKMNVNLFDLGVSIISIRGSEKGKYHLALWREITRDAQIPFFILLDSHAKDEANELIRKKLIGRDFCVVLKTHSIEENYPKNLVLEAIKKEFGIELKSNELPNTEALIIKKVLEEKGMELNNWWKPILGRRVAEMMKEEDIPDEIRRLIERIQLTLAS